VHRASLLGRLAASLVAIAAVTGFYTEIVQVNPTTAALTYLLTILLIASWWGITESTAASLAAMLCFNFFFLPPVGTLTIADPQNWVALVAFLATAIVTSQLSGRARQRELDLAARQQDLERLYALSRSLLLWEGDTPILPTIARHIAEVFQLKAAALFDRETNTFAWGGPSEIPGIEDKLRDVARQGISLRDPSGMIIIAIRLGGAPIGSLAIMDAQLSDTVLQSLANLAAIGVERVRGQEAAARADAARESGELRATVLDALAHEFKTPLTSMKAATSDLLSTSATAPRDRELVEIIDQDLDRLQVLVTDAVHMLRIDAGDFVVHRDRHNLADIINSTLAKFEPRLNGHPVISRVSEDLTADVDRDLLALALRQLLDNAVKYSFPNSTIEITATGNGSTLIGVRNSGPPIPEHERTRVLERFYRGAKARHIPGTGMGLSIVQQIANTHGGSLTLSSAPDSSTEFTLSLPRGEPQS
jgi:two-component system sensor histidine kinase KdpD